MNKHILLFLFFCGHLSFVSAQRGNGDRFEKIQALKIAFITQKINLTSAEAEKFWPVYHRYENEIRQLRNSNRNGDGDRDVLDNEQRLLNIKKKYKPSFERIIGPQRLNDLFNAEKDFRNILIRKLKNQKQPGGKH